MRKGNYKKKKELHYDEYIIETFDKPFEMFSFLK